MNTAIQSCDGGSTGQPKVPVADHEPDNVGSAGLVRLLPSVRTVTTQQPGEAGNRASESPAGNDIDAPWPHRLAAANRLLIEENARLKAQVAAGEEAVRLIESWGGDLQRTPSDVIRALRVIRTWKEAGHG